jgi:hypothetical protein
MSALKNAGEAPLDARLIKLAVQQSAHRLPGVEALRQGAGVIDVASAYDVYRTLAAEQRAARADATHRTKFAYELRAEAALDGESVVGEGVVLKGLRASVPVTVKIVGESATLVDPLATVEPLVVEHDADFITTPDVVNLQLPQARFEVRLEADKLREPGIYTDVVTLKRASDGLVLLRVPVAVTIAAEERTDGALAAIDTTLTPTGVWRQPVELTQADQLVVDAVALDLGGNDAASVILQVFDARGNAYTSTSAPLQGPVATISYRSPVLPAGLYELTLTSTYGQPASLGNIKVTGSVRAPKASQLAADSDGSNVTVALATRTTLAFDKASLVLSRTLSTQTLALGEGSRGRKGFLGQITLAEPAASIGLALRQTGLDLALESFLHVELMLVDHETGQPLFRGWHDLKLPGGHADTIALSAPAKGIDVLAYPNIVDWSTVRTDTLALDVEAPLATPVTLAAAVPAGSAGSGRTLTITLPGAAPAHAAGELTLLRGETVVEKVAVTLP